MKISLYKKIFIFLCLPMLITLQFCSKENPAEPPPANQLDTYYPKIIILQETAGQLFETLITQIDSTAALDSLVKIFLADTSVKSAAADIQGVAVEYNNGIKGGVFTNPQDYPGEGPLPLLKNSEIVPVNLNKNTYTIPRSTKTILMNSHFYERQQQFDWLKLRYNTYLPKVQMNMLFTRIKNLGVGGSATCLVDEFTDLSDYGYVHIYSHGWAWPTENNIAEVYVLTGEEVSNQTSTKYWEDVKAGKIIMAYVSQHHSNVYWLSPDFVSSKNNFGTNNTLFYGGFCYSFLGSWANKITGVSNAAVYIGFDWSVFTWKNVEWASVLGYQLSDTSQPKPMVMEEWINDTSFTKRSYWDSHNNRTVKVHYAGKSDFALWEKMKVDSLVPNKGSIGTVVEIRGGGFGHSRPYGSTVKFNNVAANITSWANDKIITAVPQGATTGNVVVIKNYKNSNGVKFTIDGPEITGVVPDSGYYGDAVVINGTHFGQSAQNGKVNFGGADATEIISWSDAQINVKVPGNASTGNIYVIVNSDTSNGVNFKILSATAPVLSELYPYSALPGNSIKITGVWQHVYNPPNSYVRINGTNYTVLENVWYSDEFMFKIPDEFPTGPAEVSIIFKGVESNKINYLIGLPLDTIRAYSNLLSSQFYFYLLVRKPDMTTTHLGAWPHSSLMPDINVQWDGRKFHAEYSDPNEPTTYWDGTISNDGAYIDSLVIETHQRDYPGVATFTLKPGEKFPLKNFYWINYTNNFRNGYGFIPPEYFIETQDILDKFEVTGTFYFNNEPCEILGIVDKPIGTNNNLPLQFKE